MSARPDKPDVQSGSDQTPPTGPSSQAPQPVQSEPPLTGQSKAEKAVEYLRRLRSKGEFDPTQPMSNQKAQEVATRATALAKEEISVSTVKDARTRLLKEPVQKATAAKETQATQGKESEASKPQPKRPPPVEVQPGAPAPAAQKEEKPPLKPEEVEKNRHFVDRLVTWVLKKSESDAPDEDKDFIIESFNDALTDSNSKVPTIVKLGLGLGMLGYYVIKSLIKVREKLQKKAEEKDKQTPEEKNP